MRAKTLIMLLAIGVAVELTFLYAHLNLKQEPPPAENFKVKTKFSEWI
jgi:hypothetical protein